MSAVYTEFFKDLIIDKLIAEGVYTEETISDVSDEDIISASAANGRIFTNYPIFDEDYRTELNKKIIYHYYLREIGAETEDRFLFYLNRTMREEMPYFNKLYNSELLSFDPLNTYNKTITHTGTNSSVSTRTDNLSSSTSSNDETENTGSENTTSKNTTSSKNSGKGSSKAGILDTPQGSVSAIGNALSDTGNGYLTNAQMSANDSSGESSGTTEQTNITSNTSKTTRSNSGSQTNTGTQRLDGSGNNSYTDKISGYEGHPAELVKEFRAQMLNIDMKVINSLAGCFMMVY